MEGNVGRSSSIRLVVQTPVSTKPKLFRLCCAVACIRLWIKNVQLFVVRCIKLTNDPPSGLRANLKQAFASISREEYSDLEPRCIHTYDKCAFLLILDENCFRRTSRLNYGRKNMAKAAPPPPILTDCWRGVTVLEHGKERYRKIQMCCAFQELDNVCPTA